MLKAINYGKYCNWLTYFSLLVVVIGISCSHILMSVGGIALAALFLISPKLIKRCIHVLKQPYTLFALALFIWHVIGMAWSDDLSSAARDIRIKLPLLLFPIALAGMYKLSALQLVWLIRIYVLTVFTNTFVLYGIYLQWYGPVVENFREISVFISHIRFSLNICLAIGLLWLYPNLVNFTKFSIILKVFSTLWGFYFLSILESGTSIVICGLLMIIWIGRHIFKNRNKKQKWVAALAILGIIGSAVFFTAQSYNRIFVPVNNNKVSLPSNTLIGNNYYHSLTNKQVENGHFVYQYFSNKELETHWEKRTKIPITQLNASGFPIQANLMRYLTSKGLTKDSIGIAQLSNEDVNSILNGATNYSFTHVNGFSKRYYTILFELHQFKNGSTPNGHSLLMRFEFIKTAFYLLKENWLTGVGTGDLRNAFKQAYVKTKSVLSEEWQHRAHNQYLSTWLALGVIGLVLFLGMFLAPFYSKNKSPDYAWLFLIIALASFLSEDTLETQAGVTFVLFFMSFFFTTPFSKKELL
jgi:hypothetical protein